MATLTLTVGRCVISAASGLALLLFLVTPADAERLSGGKSVALQCGPDPAPAPAAAIGMTCETFWDDFTSSSTIDMTNSLAPGFKWYLGNNWPRALDLNWPGGAPVTTPTPTSWFSIGSGGLSISALIDDVRGQVLLTSCGPIASAPFYVGTPITGGFFLRTVQGASGSSGANAWPLIWTFPTEFLVGGVGGAAVFVENDHLEGHANQPVGNFQRLLHHWLYPGHNDNAFGGPHGAPPTTGTVADSFVVPAALNGGTSKMDYYVNGVVESVTDSTSYPGSFDLYMSNHNCIILGSGFGSTLVLRSLQVWQTPP